MIRFTVDAVFITLADGRTFEVALDDVPWLRDATPPQKAHVEVSGFSIYWPDLDDGIDLRWAAERAARNGDE